MYVCYMNASHEWFYSTMQTVMHARQYRHAHLAFTFTPWSLISIPFAFLSNGLNWVSETAAVISIAWFDPFTITANACESRGSPLLIMAKINALNNGGLPHHFTAFYEFLMVFYSDSVKWKQWTFSCFFKDALRHSPIMSKTKTMF